MAIPSPGLLAVMRRPRALLVLLAIALPALLVVSTLILAIGNRDADVRLTRLRTTLTSSLNDREACLTRQLDIILSDLCFTAMLPDALPPGSSRSADYGGTVAPTLMTLAHAKPIYTRIAYIDTVGMEVLAIARNNGGEPTLVSRPELRTMQKSPAFLEAVKLNEHEAYLASIDKANSGPESSLYSSSLSLATPVWAGSGELLRVAVINADLAGIARMLAMHEPEAVSAPLLVDADGAYLHRDGAGINDSLGSGSFMSDYPGEWEAIATAGEGMLQSEHGLFAYRRLHLAPRPPAAAGIFNGAEARSGGSSGETFYWIMIQRVEPERLATIAALQPGLLFLMAIMALFIMLASLALVLWIERNNANRKLLVTLAGSLPVFIFMKDRKGRYSFANDYALSSLGIEIGELHGKRVDELLGTEEAARIRAEDDAVMNKGEELLNKEEQIKLPDGRKVPVLTSKVPLKDVSGRIEGLISISMDRTRQLAAEDEARRLSNQLRKKQHIETLGTLSGGIAHDFNNLLTPIIGYSELAIKELGEGSPAGASLTTVIRSAEKARNLVRQMMMFSRNEQLEQRKQALLPIVAEAIDFVRHTIPSTVSIELQADGFSGTVLCDSLQIQQAVINLCMNAWQSIEKDYGTIIVELSRKRARPTSARRLKNRNPSQEYAAIAVIDQGKGMSAHEVERMFDPFYTTKEVGKGTGLGLSVVYGVVESHQGDIDVESAPGKGTVVTLYLPLLCDNTSSDNQ